MTTRLVAKDILRKVLSRQNNLTLLDKLPDFVKLCIDSRTLQPGDIFFAIRGEINDGHNFIKDAVEQGAALVIAEEAYKNRFNGNLPIIFVNNSLDTFSLLAHLHLANFLVAKIAITGSNGKTTTKEMIKAALISVLGQDKVYASLGNKNNHFGVPLSALEVTPKHQVAIFEMGMNHEGEIARLCDIIEPSIGVITNISYAHGGNFVDGIDGVQRAKGELFFGLMKNNGMAIVNLDDDRVVFLAEQAKILRKLSFGSHAEADIRILSCEPFSLTLGSQTVTISLKGGKIIRCQVPLAGSHHAINAACALAVVEALGLSAELAAVGIMHMAKTKGRMSVNKTDRGYLLINDGYNANPTSMKAGIEASLDFPAKRRIAAIGAMGELGDKSAAYHFELGKLLATHFDYLFVCGADGQYVVEGAKSANMPEQKIVFKNTSTDLIEPLKTLLTDGDLIFIKGSLSANMLAITRALEGQ